MSATTGPARRGRRGPALVGMAMAAAVVAACSGGAADENKAGGDPVPVTLRLGTIEPSWAPYAAGVEEFAREVEERSGGSVRIDLDWETLGGWHPQAEVEVAGLVRDGDLDLALVPARAWDELGVTSLQALQAPFLVSSDGLVADVARSELAGELMAGLGEAEVMGLALLPESLRHPVGYTEPVQTAADFNGLTIRVPVSDLSYRLMDALGAEPVDEAEFHSAVVAGDLAAVESAFAWTDDLPPGGVFTANITFYPKVNVLVAGEAALERLSDDQRDVLDDAATAALELVIETGGSDAAAAAEYCAAGGTVVVAADEEIAALEAAAGSVYADLEDDAVTGTLIERIRAMKAEHEASADEPRPVACTATETAPPVAGGEAAEFPAGTYRAQLDREGLVQRGMDAVSADNFQGLNTLVMADGRYEWTSPEAAPPTCHGTYTVADGRVTLVQDGVCGDGPDAMVVLDAAWTLDGRDLTFTDIRSNGMGDAFAAAYWGAGSWTRLDD